MYRLRDLRDGCRMDVNLDFNCSKFLVDLIALWCLVLFESGKWLDIDYRRRSLCVMCDLTYSTELKGEIIALIESFRHFAISQN